MALNPLLFLAFFQKRNKWFSVSFIEPAEHLVILQTQYLDRYQQCLKAGNEDISENNNRPADAAAACCSAEHQDNLHHG